MFLISLITGVVFGLAPAIESTKSNLTDALNRRINDKQTSHLSFLRLRNLLVIGQVAVSLVLLIGAGLLVRGLQRGAIDRSRIRSKEPARLVTGSSDAGS